MIETECAPQESAEAEVLTKAKARDQAAWRSIYEEYARTMFKMALRILSHRSDAEDAVQTAFMQAWCHIDDFRGESALGTWLIRITIRVCIRALKKRPPTSSLDDAKFIPEKSGNCRHLSSLTKTKVDLTAVEEAIAGLPEKERKPFVLHHINGLSHREIGESLNISEQTSRNRCFSAMKKVRAYIYDMSRP